MLCTESLWSGYSIKALRTTIPLALASVSQSLILKFWKRTERMIQVYREGFAYGTSEFVSRVKRVYQSPPCFWCCTRLMKYLFYIILLASLGLSWLSRFGICCNLWIFPVHIYRCRHHNRSKDRDSPKNIGEPSTTAGQCCMRCPMGTQSLSKWLWKWSRSLPKVSTGNDEHPSGKYDVLSQAHSRTIFFSQIAYIPSRYHVEIKSLSAKFCLSPRKSDFLLLLYKSIYIYSTHFYYS
jgi:hypothetical protein